MATLIPTVLRDELFDWTRADWLVAGGTVTVVASASQAGLSAEGALRRPLPAASGFEHVAVALGTLSPFLLILLALGAVMLLAGLLGRPVRFFPLRRALSLALAVLALVCAAFAIFVSAIAIYVAASGQIGALPFVADEKLGVGDRFRVALGQSVGFLPLAALFAAIGVGALLLGRAEREQE
jgi:hypothetical protein